MSNRIPDVLSRTTGITPDTDPECEICLLPMNPTDSTIQHISHDPSAKPCKRVWHFNCIKDWVQRFAEGHPKCPRCRCRCQFAVGSGAGFVQHFVVDSTHGKFSIADRLGHGTGQCTLPVEVSRAYEIVGLLGPRDVVPLTTLLMMRQNLELDLESHRLMWFCSRILGVDQFGSIPMETHASTRFYIPILPPVTFLADLEHLESRIGHERYELLKSEGPANLQVPLTMSFIRKLLSAKSMSDLAASAMEAFHLWRQGRTVPDLLATYPQLRRAEDGPHYWGLFHVVTGDNREIFCIPWAKRLVEVLDDSLPAVYPGFRQNLQLQNPFSANDDKKYLDDLVMQIVYDAVLDESDEEGDNSDESDEYRPYDQDEDMADAPHELDDQD